MDASASTGGARWGMQTEGCWHALRRWPATGLVRRAAESEESIERITDIQLRLAKGFSNSAWTAATLETVTGAQRSLLFSPKIWQRMIKPRLGRMFALFREAGLPVILHSDGDIWPILPDLVDIGLTCLNPVQPEVLAHARLYRESGRHLSFYGGISTQDVLPKATPAEVRATTLACVRISPRTARGHYRPVRPHAIGHSRREC